MPDNTAIRLARLEVEVPELFDRGQAGTVLYVGACPQRCDYMVDLHAVGHELTVLEIWEENIEALEESPFRRYFAHIMLGDVRQLATTRLPYRTYDFTFWWHGPEHLNCPGIAPAVQALEALTRKTVILGSPWGVYRSGAVWGNPYNTHLCHLYQQDYMQLGYEVATLGSKDKRGSCLLAWRCLTREAQGEAS